uniref:Uncharacterized protein n=1 Tax=Schistosoma japonicum TaxID=6182 RepID=Q5BYG7_SCHJA|nr:unknown [Schistosoma japonicum]
MNNYEKTFLVCSSIVLRHDNIIIHNAYNEAVVCYTGHIEYLSNNIDSW